MKPKTNAIPATPQIRVAIYTRQSVATDLEFGSIDAQREAVEAYVASQRGEGWMALPDHYDDRGFSGGNAESKDDSHTDKIDVLSWSRGMSQSGSFQVGGGSGSGKVDVQAILNFAE